MPNTLFALYAMYILFTLLIFLFLFLCRLCAGPMLNLISISFFSFLMNFILFFYFVLGTFGRVCYVYVVYRLSNQLICNCTFVWMLKKTKSFGANYVEKVETVLNWYSSNMESSQHVIRTYTNVKCFFSMYSFKLQTMRQTYNSPNIMWF